MSDRLTEGFISRFLGMLRGKKADPNAPQNKVGPTDGHGGMALRDIGRGREDVSDDNRKAWRKLGNNEAADFVYNGSILYVHSSNVQSAQYLIETRQMIVAYKNDDVWLYGDISEDEAIGFAQALSKGAWVWDNVKVRGTVHQHKKPARQIA